MAISGSRALRLTSKFLMDHPLRRLFEGGVEPAESRDPGRERAADRGGRIGIEMIVGGHGTDPGCQC
ncbi:hypothetical protein CO251_03730 [Sulfobacillus sp. hq2]|nr:hypothetical protein CO251_03730 [Sulfobacillus sp. hq2]